MVEEFFKLPEVKRIEKDYKIYQDFLRETADLSKWTKFTDTKDQKLYYKQEKDLTPLTCYMEGVVNSSILNVGLICGEVDYFKDWLPITPVSEILKSLTPFRKIMYIRNSLQWPFWHREIFVEAGAFVIPGKRALGLSMETYRENDWHGYQLQREPEKYVETHINRGFLFVEYINDECCLVKALINIDIHLEMIP